MLSLSLEYVNLSSNRNIVRFFPSPVESIQVNKKCCGNSQNYLSGIDENNSKLLYCLHLDSLLVI